MSHEMSLLKGTPIMVDGVGGIYPLKLSEIEEIGIEKYQEMLFHLLFDKKTVEIPELQDLLESDDTSDFDMVFALCIYDETFRNKLFAALKMITKKEPFISNEGFFYLSDIKEERFIHRDNFEQIKTIVRKQNMLEDKTKHFKARNNKANEIKEKLMAMKKLVQATKEKKNDGLTLEDIISIVASNSHTLNHMNIWDYTIYQLYEYFNRMMKRDNFEQQWSLILRGADIKSSDLKHWAT